MDASIATLLGSLTQSFKNAVKARSAAAEANAHLKYAELTGHIDTMRTVIDFIQQAAQLDALPKQDMPEGKMPRVRSEVESEADEAPSKEPAPADLEPKDDEGEESVPPPETPEEEPKK